MSLFRVLLLRWLLSFVAKSGAKLVEITKKNKKFSVKKQIDLSVWEKVSNFAPHFAKILEQIQNL